MVISITETFFKTVSEIGRLVFLISSTKGPAKVSAAKALARKPARVIPI